MKRSDQGIKTISVLAILACLIVPFQVLATDYFPLDVWEEMESWEQNKVTVDATNVGAYDSTNMIEDASLNKMFPFDVQGELDKLGGIEWVTFENRKVNYINYGTLRENKSNPYWMPEELRYH